jgi:UDP-N-acetylmuramoyl-tripeptide--D-alanyl-D-alanine ligase
VAAATGKTTPKERLASVLRQKFETLASRASFNNDIGVPVTLLELNRHHRVAVLEFGTNHPGELAPLLQMAGPQVGVLTSIGREHLEFFKDLEGVIREEGFLAESLPPEGKLFINADTPGVDQIIRRSRAPVVRVGTGREAAWRASAIRMDEAGVSFAVEAEPPGFNRVFRVPLLGRHQATNALLAIAVGAEFGLSPEEIQAGLTACAPAKMRLESWCVNGVRFLDDSYNANADSMRAALDTLHEYPCEGRRLAVLGDMAELGEHAAESHVEIGRRAAAVANELWAVGSQAGLLAKGAREAGLEIVREFSEPQSVVDALRAALQPGDVVLLKASRAAGLDRIGERLRAEVPSSANRDPSQGRSGGGAR